MSVSKGLPVALAIVVTTAVAFFVARGRYAGSRVIREGEEIVLRKAPPQPKPDEVGAKVQQIFGGVVTVASDLRPYFLAGDFSGDGLQDLAVFVTPTPSGLKGVNSEVANWILEDPFVFLHVRPEQRVTHETLPRERVQAEPEDVLLAIIHGYGPDCWRSPAARQTFLLRKAAASGVHAEPFSEKLLPRNARLLMSTPKIDVIRETLAGGPGFLYWTGAKYAWAAFGPEGTLVTSS